MYSGDEFYPDDVTSPEAIEADPEEEPRRPLTDREARRMFAAIDEAESNRAFRRGSR